MDNREKALIMGLIYIPDLIKTELDKNEALIVQKLIRENYLQVINKSKKFFNADNLIVSDKALNELNKIDEPVTRNIELVEDWIDEWRELFPKGRNGGNRPYKGEKQNCINKMKWFISEFKIPKEDIFNTTIQYIKSVTDPAYISCADYFIVKDGISRLHMEYENYKVGGNIIKLKDKIL